MEGVGQGGISQVHNRLCMLSQPIIEEQGPTPSRAEYPSQRGPGRMRHTRLHRCCRMTGSASAGLVY